MVREQVTVQSRQALIYDGTGEVMCDVRDTPHIWDVLLRCSQEELAAFRSLRPGASLQVEVGSAGVERAQLTAIEEPRHVRLAGLGFCPYPNH